MSEKDRDITTQKTQWTNALLEDLCTALSGKREDDTVRGFARELMDDKDLPIDYLVRKVYKMVGPAEAERLDILIRGKYMVEKSKVEQEKVEQAKSQGGLFGFVRKLLG